MKTILAARAVRAPLAVQNAEQRDLLVRFLKEVAIKENAEKARQAWDFV